MRRGFVIDLSARGVAALGLVACLVLIAPVGRAAPSTAKPAAATPATPATMEDHCPDAAGFLTSEEPLTALAGAIAAGKPVDVLAVGSAIAIGEENGTGTGTGNENGNGNGNGNGGSFPYHMIDALHAALPAVDFRLTLQGARGLTAQDMLRVLDAQLAGHRYPLVLWQTGTVEAVRGLRPDSLHAALEAGVLHIRARGGDTVLIDPNYSRALRANTEIDPYMQVLRQVAGLPGVVLFPRYDLTRAWVQKGELDVESAPKAQRVAAVDALHRCVGAALARFVLRSLRLAGP
jgi:acyl-CoA thioesterase-1